MIAEVARFALGALLLAIALVFVRLVRGPTLPDRVVALDTIAIIAVAFLAVFAIASGRPAYLDAAITLALVAFLATLAFARYTERSAEERKEVERSPPS